MKDVLILTGAGQISLAIARRIGDDKKSLSEIGILVMQIIFRKF